MDLNPASKPEHLEGSQHHEQSQHSPSKDLRGGRQTDLPARHRQNLIPLNAADHRLDTRFTETDHKRSKPLHAYAPGACSSYHRTGECFDLHCSFSHEQLPLVVLTALRVQNRHMPCPEGGTCRSVRCIYGHICCQAHCNKSISLQCRMPEAMHNLDRRVSKWVPGIDKPPGMKNVKSPASVLQVLSQRSCDSIVPRTVRDWKQFASAHEKNDAQVKEGLIANGCKFYGKEGIKGFVKDENSAQAEGVIDTTPAKQIPNISAPTSPYARPIMQNRESVAPSSSHAAPTPIYEIITPSKSTSGLLYAALGPLHGAPEPLSVVSGQQTIPLYEVTIPSHTVPPHAATGPLSAASRQQATPPHGVTRLLHTAPGQALIPQSAAPGQQMQTLYPTYTRFDTTPRPLPAVSAAVSAAPAFPSATPAALSAAARQPISNLYPVSTPLYITPRPSQAEPEPLRELSNQQNRGSSAPRSLHTPLQTQIQNNPPARTLNAPPEGQRGAYSSLIVPHVPLHYANLRLSTATAPRASRALRARQMRGASGPSRSLYMTPGRVNKARDYSRPRYVDPPSSSRAPVAGLSSRPNTWINYASGQEDHDFDTQEAFFAIDELFYKENNPAQESTQGSAVLGNFRPTCAVGEKTMSEGDEGTTQVAAHSSTSGGLVNITNFVDDDENIYAKENTIRANAEKALFFDDEAETPQSATCHVKVSGEDHNVQTAAGELISFAEETITQPAIIATTPLELDSFAQAATKEDIPSDSSSEDLILDWVEGQ